jgi:decaprenyl-phosphate phosphoribosyltransferase
MTPNPDAQVLALPAARPGAAAKVLALVRTARPRQWTKNVLVFSVPAVSGTLLLGPVLSSSLFALGAFCLVASGTYLINDAADAEADRMHPVKRNRPVAAGLVSVTEARVAGVVLLAAGLALALAANAPLAGVVAGYVVLTVSYTRWLKHQPIFDIAAVAAGFFLRAVAGGVASDLYMSRWFLIVAGGGSLFLIVGKRYAESLAGGEEAARRRSSLAAYTHDYLRGMLTTTASVTVLAYCLWAFEGSAAQEPSAWTALSAVPFVMGIMRYGLVLEQGKGEEPQDVVLGDRTLQALGLAWVALLCVGVVG